ncbi:GMC oxidoreductase [Rhizobium ruizarguesonis]|uniref:GMC oxidoreductase n=1 Tax=Rhizobium ruizarguesonis TaxID=2081791 RepID=UPI001031BA25|nr:GMC family oxidoreductase [Rhizobium ruizarguesonis]TBA11998.1 GMC family oxidoreductase [Rhizobium ruizarguesonis]
MTNAHVFDVVVVGSGAAGGMVAHDLTKAGADVLLLEAGRDYDPQVETPMFQTPQSAPLRGLGLDIEKPAGYFDATVDGGWTVPGEPYVLAENSEPFQWWRSRMLGGRTNHWGRVALRFGAYDFKPKSRDGLGFDWPLEYNDLAPWYDEVERLIGVTGAAEGLENSPDSPAGILLPPPPLRVHEIFLSRAFSKLGMNVAAIHAAILTKPYNGRAECLYSTQCTRGCSSRSNFQSTTVLLPDARATGNLTVGCDAVVYQIDLDKHGLATGVSFVNRRTDQHSNVKGRVVVLAAGAFSSTRILMNSKSATFPEGIGSTSGFLGKHIMDSLEYTLSSRVPALENVPPQNDDGIFAPHIYVPWWLYEEQKNRKLDFPRGYHIEPRGGRRMPTMGVARYVADTDLTYGSDLRDLIQRRYGTYVFLTGEGEMIPNDHCYCELDPDVTDRWGIPVLRFHWRWGEPEILQGQHMLATFNQVFAALGGTTTPGSITMPPGGSSVHEVGGARMGSSQQESVVDAFGQCWDVKNVFVLDGAVFASHPDKNPTLTILALAKRGAARILELSKGGTQ